MAPSISNELHKIIDESSEYRIQEINDWINNGMAETAKYSPAEIKQFYSLPEEHKAGLSKLYTVAETFAIARSSKNP